MDSLSDFTVFDQLILMISQYFVFCFLITELNINLTYMLKVKQSSKKASAKPVSLTASITIEKTQKFRSTTLKGDSQNDQYFSRIVRKTSRKGSLGKANLSEVMNHSHTHEQSQQLYTVSKNLSTTYPRRMLNLELELQEQKRLVA